MERDESDQDGLEWGVYKNGNTLWKMMGGKE